MMRGSENDFMQRLVDNSPHVTVYDEYRNPRQQPVQIAFPSAIADIHGMKPRTELRGIRQYKEKLALIARRTDLQIAAVLQGPVIPHLFETLSIA